MDEQGVVGPEEEAAGVMTEDREINATEAENEGAEPVVSQGVAELEEEATGARTEDEGLGRYFVEVLYSENVKVTVVVRPENARVVLGMVRVVGGTTS